MNQVNIGIRITEEGLGFFGIEEVNERIVQGYRVIRIEPGNAIVEEIEGEDDEEAFALAGCDMVVVLEAPSV